MAYTLTERNVRKIERFARASKIGKILAFFESLPRTVVIPRPMLIGSGLRHCRFVTGYALASSLIDEIWFLDEPYDPDPIAPSVTLSFNRRTERIDSIVMPALVEGLRQKPPRLCLARHLGGCTSTVSAAHTIQRSELERFASPDGHVYGIRPGGKRNSHSRMVPERIGINDATTFCGLCNKHDTELFKPIEVQPFSRSRDELFLWHYRAVLFEYYRRHFGYERLQKIYARLCDAGHSADVPRIRDVLNGNAIDSAEVEAIKAICDEGFIGRTWDAFFLKAWVAAGPLPVLGTMAFAPRKDFQGRFVQRAEPGREMAWVSLTITLKDGNGLVVIGANCRTNVAMQLADSLDKVPADRRAQTISVYALTLMENAVILPHCWEGLDRAGQTAVINTIHARYFPRTLPLFAPTQLRPVQVG